MNRHRFLFGPVPSRRLGRSLGVDVIPRKLCSLDCIYCELGPTDKRGLKRREYVPPSAVLPEIHEAVRKGGIDTITFTGSGEPTLNSALGVMIRAVKDFTTIPVAVLTNGTLLSLEEVQRDLLDADIVLPSLDAATHQAFAAVNRPHPHLSLREMIDGLVRFRSRYRGNLWLEVFIVRGINDSDSEIRAIAEAIALIRPDRVQLNTVVRPPAVETAQPVERQRLEEIRMLFGPSCEIIAPASSRTAVHTIPDTQALLETLDRRPMDAAQIASMIGKPEELVRGWLDELELEGVLSPYVLKGVKFYKHTLQHRVGQS